MDVNSSIGHELPAGWVLHWDNSYEDVTDLVGIVDLSPYRFGLSGLDALWERTPINASISRAIAKTLVGVTELLRNEGFRVAPGPTYILVQGRGDGDAYEDIWPPRVLRVGPGCVVADWRQWELSMTVADIIHDVEYGGTVEGRALVTVDGLVTALSYPHVADLPLPFGPHPHHFHGTNRWASPLWRPIVIDPTPFPGLADLEAYPGVVRCSPHLGWDMAVGAAGLLPAGIVPRSLATVMVGAQVLRCAATGLRVRYMQGRFLGIPLVSRVNEFYRFDFPSGIGGDPTLADFASVPQAADAEHEVDADVP